MDSPLGRFGDDDPDEMVTVQLLQAPLLLWQRTAEHHDELMRELALLALSPPRPELPSRLLELVDVLGRRYGAAGSRPDAERDAGVAAGLDRLDLSFVVPRSSGAAAQRMRTLLEEVERYCGSDLLTVAQPPVQVDFARWYSDQFVDQCAGAGPAPWPGPWD
jgi:hypothetical protein